MFYWLKFQHKLRTLQRFSEKNFFSIYWGKKIGNHVSYNNTSELHFLHKVATKSYYSQGIEASGASKTHLKRSCCLYKAAHVCMDAMTWVWPQGSDNVHKGQIGNIHLECRKTWGPVYFFSCLIRKHTKRVWYYYQIIIVT